MLFTLLHGWASEKEAKHFLLPRRKFCAFKICCLGAQNNRETFSQCFFSVSHMLPRLRLDTTYLEDTEFVSWKQKMFLIFCKNILCILNAIFCFHNNVSSFAPAFIPFTNRCSLLLLLLILLSCILLLQYFETQPQILAIVVVAYPQADDMVILASSLWYSFWNRNSSLTHDIKTVCSLFTVYTYTILILLLRWPSETAVSCAI